MKLLVLSQILIFVSYVIFIWKREGVLSSISASSYRLEGNQKGLFSGWLILLGITSCLYVLFDAMGVWAGIMGVGFAISGMSPDHKSNPNTMEDFFHTFGTVVAVVAGFAGIVLVHGLLWVAIVGAVGTVILYLLVKTGIVKNLVWWLECWYMLIIATGLLSI